jgi:hypothetical protein
MQGLEHFSLGFDKNTMTAEISDSGNERFQTTNLGFVAKVVAAILKYPAQASNKYITIASFNISQREILALAKKVSGKEWIVKSWKVDDIQRAAEKDLANGNFDAAFYPLLHGRLFRDNADLALKPGQNFAQEVLGFSEEDPVDAIKAWFED